MKAGSCPRCFEEDAPQPLRPDHGQLHEAVCPRCQGRFLDRDQSERILVEQLGLSRGTLSELAGMFGGQPLACPGCGQQTRPVTLRGVPVDLCFACGGLWCDPGALGRLSAGSVEEVPLLAEGGPEVLEPAGRRSRRVRPGGTAVFLFSAEPPDVDAVARALTPFAEYTRSDAQPLARRACGILLDGIHREDAAQVVAGLRTAGVEAAVDDARWLTIGAPARSRKLSIREDRLVLSDTYNQDVVVDPAEVAAAAFGRLPFTESTFQFASARLQARRRQGWSSGHHRGGGSGGAAERYEDLRQRGGRQVEQQALDLYTRRGWYRILDDASIKLPEGPARPGRRLQTAVLLLEPALAGAGLTRGFVQLVREGKVLRYQAAREMERELAWTLWRRTLPQGRVPLPSA